MSMSPTYLIFQLVGLLLIVNYLRRKIRYFNRAIEIGTIPGSSFPKLPMVRKAEYDKFLYQFGGALGIICYLAITFNFKYEIVGAWVILCVVGFSFASVLYLVNTAPIDYEEVDENQVSNLQRLLRAEEAKKISILILAGTLGLSGYWSTQVAKNVSAEREIAVNDVSGLTETGWCSNFEDINVYDGGQEVVKKGGWPCIYIGSIDGFTFSRENKKDKMCGWVNLHRETGAPGEESFQLSYRSFETCITEDDWGGRLSEKAFSDKIYDEVKPELDSLQQTLCRNYGYRMGEINYSTYC